MSSHEEENNTTSDTNALQAKEGFFARFLRRWHIETKFELYMILIAFSLAGMSVGFVRKFIFHLIGVQASTPWIYKFILWVVTIYPSYYCLLFIIGTLLGQYKFVFPFCRQGLGRILPFLKEKKASDNDA